MARILPIIFRKGIRPSPAVHFDYNNLTPTQKLELARCRIFGLLLNSNYSQGARAWKKHYRIDLVEKRQPFTINMIDVR